MRLSYCHWPKASLGLINHTDYNQSMINRTDKKNCNAAQGKNDQIIIGNNNNIKVFMKSIAVRVKY